MVRAIRWGQKSLRPLTSSSSKNLGSPWWVDAAEQRRPTSAPWRRGWAATSLLAGHPSQNQVWRASISTFPSPRTTPTSLLVSEPMRMDRKPSGKLFLRAVSRTALTSPRSRYAMVLTCSMSVLTMWVAMGWQIFKSSSPDLPRPPHSPSSLTRQSPPSSKPEWS